MTTVKLQKKNIIPSRSKVQIFTIKYEFRMLLLIEYMSFAEKKISENSKKKEKEKRNQHPCETFF